MNKNKKIIKTCWFDLGNVILPFDFAPAFKKLGRLAGINPSKIQNYIQKKTHLEADLDEGRLHSYQLYQMIKNSFSIKTLRYDEFKEIWNDIFKENSIVSKTIRKLKLSGVRLILISNTNKLHFEHIKETYPVMKEFDRFVLSYKIKCRKPKAEIFDAALRHSKCEPQHIFYTDDRSELTRAAQKSHGVNVHIFKTQVGLRTALKSHGVKL